MKLRRRLPSSIALLAALTTSLVPAAPAEALYARHEGVVSENPADTTPHVLSDTAAEDGAKVAAILPVGDRIYVGGNFSRVTDATGGAPLARKGLFAFDARTGTVDRSFAPVFAVESDSLGGDGVEALALAPDGGILVGGKANLLDGRLTTDPVSKHKLVKLDPATGARATSFNSKISNGVKDVVVSGRRLFVAGQFDTVGGSANPRKGLAVLDAVTGGLDPTMSVPFEEPRSGSPRVETIAVSPDGTTLVAAGNFLRAGGLSRAQIALLDVTPGRTARVLDWHTSLFEVETQCADRAFDSFMRDVDISPDGRYFALVTTGGFSQSRLCDSTSRWELSARGSNLEPTWYDKSGGDSFTGVVATGAAVYVSGHIRSMNNNDPDGTTEGAKPGPGAVPREGIAALDPQTGLPLSWNPGRARGEGAYALVATETGLWVGSDTDGIGGEEHHKLAFFPLAGGKAVPSFSSASLGGAELYTISAGSGVISRRPFDGTALGVTAPFGGGGDWAAVRGAFALGDRLYTGHADGRLRVRSVSPAGIGTPSELDLYGLTIEEGFPVERISGMFWDAGKLYYTLTGDRSLRSRWFSPESGVVGYDRWTVSGPSVDGLDWRDTTGVTMAGGRLTHSRNGVLWAMDFRDGAPVPGTEVLVEGAAGSDWTSLGMFVLAGTAAPPAQPVPPGTAVPGLLSRPGYWMATADGGVYSYGSAGFFGSAGGTRLNQPIVGLAPTPAARGYWLVATDGGIFAYGDATFHGSTGAIALNKPIVGMAATPTGKGYWLVASDGGIFAYGDATFFGSTGDLKLNQPIVGMAATPTGRGYWLVASDGGIFAFGDARFFGSTGASTLNEPIVGMAATPTGRGYWLVATDGGIFAYGDAAFFGSTGDIKLNSPIVGMAPAPGGAGYWLNAADGGTFSFGDAPFLGSMGGRPLPAPMVSFQSVR